ncbi:GTPase ObgE [Candidatus Saccharibacteria bacterium]|nr:GTPase ObgE [Exiguobacterium sp.]MBR3156908.1 GTPase ObgE [Candidatus Saccharibacteria bacterium]
MFVDKAKVSLKAGKGGNGAVSFRREIYIPKGGPDGGDGGKGGDIVFLADKDTNSLVDFRFTPILEAANGKNGSGQRSAGRSGEDLIVKVPVGTSVYRLEHDGYPRVLVADLVQNGQKVIIAHGGDGGFGNAHFKSSTRQAPLIAEVGEPGEEFEAELELKSMADVGLVGLPNAGKSTFLSVVSNAKPEIADYPFTTLTPHIGVATVDGKDLLIADIPGLIEGAAEGKGLGHDFLRHVDRTSVLLHLIDIYNNDTGEAYQTIRNELEKYSDLASRPEIIALTKCEGVGEDIIKMQMASILKKNPNAKIFAISSQAHQGITELLRELAAGVAECHFSGPDVESSTSYIGNKERATKDGFVSIRDNGSELASEPRNDRRRSRGDEKLAFRLEATPNGRPSVDGSERSGEQNHLLSEVPTISLKNDQLKDTWQVKQDGDKFIVTGEKIEKFARRTDLDNYASLNRLRDIMKKMGIHAELTSRGAKPESIIEVAGKDFTLVEDW